MLKLETLKKLREIHDKIFQALLFYQVIEGKSSVKNTGHKILTLNYAIPTSETYTTLTSDHVHVK
jgi:hypothetical protein